MDAVRVAAVLTADAGPEVRLGRPALVDRLVPITHYLPDGAAIAVVSPERVVTRSISLAETNREFLAAAWSAATVGANAPIDLASGVIGESLNDDARASAVVDRFLADLEADQNSKAGN